MFKKIVAIWRGVPDGVKRVLHTFWQAFASALLISAAGVHDISTAKAALLAAAAAGLSAVKGALLARR